MRVLILAAQSNDKRAALLQGARAEFSLRVDSRVETFDVVDLAAAAADAEFCFVCLSGTAGRVFNVIQRLRAVTPQPMLIVGASTDAKLILHALKLGADLFVDQGEIGSSLGSALARFRGKAPSVDAPLGDVYGVLSAGGGCGASTLAINVASLCAKMHDKCILMDLNPGRGDLATLLDLHPQYTLANVCENEARLDHAMFGKMLAPHSSGVQLLAAPPEFSEVRSVTAAGVRHAIQLARESAGHVIIDLEDCFHDEQVEALRMLTGLYLVCRLDFTSLRNARRIIESLGKNDVARERLTVIVNHVGLPGELPLEDAEQALDHKVDVLVPHDPKLINLANNTGIPAVLKKPDSKFAQVLSGMLGASAPRRASSAQSGLLPRLVGICKSIL